jgi:hypothetical protein
MKFSERHGYRPVSDAIVREDLTPHQRTGLWNILKTFVWDQWKDYDYGWTPDSQEINVFMKKLWVFFLKADLDTLPPFKSYQRSQDGYKVIKDFFLHSKWYEVFDFLEFVAKNLESLFRDDCKKALNTMLEREGSAYRMVDSEIIEITDKQEILAIEDGLATSSAAIRSHLSRSLELLSDRESPDYRNSIKESISAVEAACRMVTGDDKATLGQALKKVTGLHPALSGGFSSIYGYTSDTNGIRHALTEDAAVAYEDAKFMLVACAAFTSFLQAKHVKQEG